VGRPFQRIAYWNKFGHPDSYLTRIGDYRDIPSLWWIDPQKDTQLAAATRDQASKFEVGPTDVRYWSERSR